MTGSRRLPLLGSRVGPSTTQARPLRRPAPPALLPQIALLALLTGCGYGFAATGPALPAGIGRIHVPVFDNRSPEPEAGALFAEALGASLAAAGREGDAHATSRVAGEVLDVTSYVSATGPAGSGAGVYRVNARVRISLIQAGAVRCTRELSGGEDYLPARDLLALEASRRAALRRLATALMADAEHKLCPFEG